MKCMQFLLFVTFEIMLRRHKYSPRRRNFVTHFPSSITNKNASLTEVKTLLTKWSSQPWYKPFNSRLLKRMSINFRAMSRLSFFKMSCDIIFLPFLRTANNLNAAANSSFNSWPAYSRNRAMVERTPSKTYHSQTLWRHHIRWSKELYV